MARLKTPGLKGNLASDYRMGTNDLHHNGNNACRCSRNTLAVKRLTKTFTTLLTSVDKFIMKCSFVAPLAFLSSGNRPHRLASAKIYDINLSDLCLAFSAPQNTKKSIERFSASY